MPTDNLFQIERQNKEQRELMQARNEKIINMDQLNP